MDLEEKKDTEYYLVTYEMSGKKKYAILNTYEREKFVRDEKYIINNITYLYKSSTPYLLTNKDDEEKVIDYINENSRDLLFKLNL